MSSCMKLFALTLLVLVGLFIFIPFVDYSVMEPEKFHLGDRAVKMLNETIATGDYLCFKTIEGSTYKWFSAYDHPDCSTH